MMAICKFCFEINEKKNRPHVFRWKIQCMAQLQSCVSVWVCAIPTLLGLLNHDRKKNVPITGQREQTPQHFSLYFSKIKQKNCLFAWTVSLGLAEKHNQHFWPSWVSTEAWWTNFRIGFVICFFFSLAWPFVVRQSTNIVKCYAKKREEKRKYLLKNFSSGKTLSSLCTMHAIPLLIDFSFAFISLRFLFLLLLLLLLQF